MGKSPAPSCLPVIVECHVRCRKRLGVVRTAEPLEHLFVLGMGYVGYDLQHLSIPVNPSAVFRRTSPFPTETGERPLTFADGIDAFKHDGMSPVIAEVVFIGSGVTFLDEISDDWHVPSGQARRLIEVRLVIRYAD